MIGDDVRIVVVSVDRDTVKLGIEAPREIPVHRSEVYEEIRRLNQAAVKEVTPPVVPTPGVIPAAPANLKPRRTPPQKN